MKNDVALRKILNHGRCCLVNGGVREKGSYHALRIGKSTIFNLITGGYITVNPETTMIKVTAKGHRLVPVDKDVANSHAKRYHAKMKAAGYVRTTFWLHNDDVKAWETFHESLNASTATTSKT